MLSLERKNGFIYLDKILELSKITNFEELIETLKKNEKVTFQNIDHSKGNIQFVFSFIYNGTKYFYKYDCPCKPFKISPYNELIAGEIATDLSIPHVEYDLATIGGFEGLISKDFCENNVQYLSGREFFKQNHPLSKEENIAYLNNLEDIWIALEEYYKKNPTLQNDVLNVMKKVVNMFIFDILTGQVDRGDSNWWMMKYPDGSLDLQPLFDNERILVLHHYLATNREPSVVKHLLTVNKDIVRYSEENLVEFLKYSDKIYSDILRNSLWVISQENLESIFARIEKKTNSSIPDEWKNYYLKEFENQLNFINEICEKTASKNK